ncbi:unnamed protein product, partial [Ectocarpus sp. 12 AP-2014]
QTTPRRARLPPHACECLGALLCYYVQFAIASLAAKLGADESAVMSKIASVTGVSSSGTVAEASRFHDDKSTYTGSHAAGGVVWSCA